MSGRRTFLKTVGGFFLASSAAGLARALPVAPGSALLDIAVRHHGAHFLVDGWVLTARDLRALNIKVPAQDDL